MSGRNLRDIIPSTQVSTPKLNPEGLQAIGPLNEFLVPDQWC